MKKVTLKLKFEELNEIYADLFNHVELSRTDRSYPKRLLEATLIELYIKIAPKLLFKKDGSTTLSLSIAQASALFIHINSTPRNASIYRDNVYLRIAAEIDKQLA